ncbi:MAG: NADH oxidase [Firmicutes bacterium ADurb.Bin193]|nr:MAG: NADH oxidase [Firmicutes bacterium ADurb.Bin193]
MHQHRRFNYDSLEQLKNDIQCLGVKIPLSEDIEVLKQPIKIGDKTIPNPLAIHPMEGCDGTSDGKPDELTFRRYDRFSKGGAGLIWLEATAVVPEGRANPRQLYICRENKSDFQALYDRIIKNASDTYSFTYKPYTVLQLTHSGRYSKPDGKPASMIATQNPYLEGSLSKNYRMITDDELEMLEDRFVQAAVIASEIGFDAVDIKSCHGYLNSELLSAFTREGRYGGSFENRTRFLLNIVDKIKARLGSKIDITLRLNAYDAVPYPYGWGVSRDDFHKPDLSEPIKLVKILYEKGVRLVNLSSGNPYYNPHVGRPYDNGLYTPPQHPLEGIANMLGIARQIQQAVPDMAVIATTFSWLREYAVNVAAGGIKEGWFKLAGFGRQALAYPDFAKDIFEAGAMERGKCCTVCSNCTVIMRDGGKTGCVIKDSKVYGPIYKQGREGKPPIRMDTTVSEHL